MQSVHRHSVVALHRVSLFLFPVTQIFGGVILSVHSSGCRQTSASWPAFSVLPGGAACCPSRWWSRELPIRITFKIGRNLEPPCGRLTSQPSSGSGVLGCRQANKASGFSLRDVSSWRLLLIVNLIGCGKSNPLYKYRLCRCSQVKSKKRQDNTGAESSRASGLTAGLADTLIDRVYVYSGNQVKDEELSHEYGVGC